MIKRYDPYDAWVTWAGRRLLQGSRLQIELHHAFVLLSGARRVRRNVRRRVARLDSLTVDQVLLDFLAADISEHVPIDFNTRRKRLSAFSFHLPAKRGILNDCTKDSMKRKKLQVGINHE